MLKYTFDTMFNLNAFLSTARLIAFFRNFVAKVQMFFNIHKFENTFLIIFKFRKFDLTTN